MHRFTFVLSTVLAALLLAAPVASAHQGNPNMESIVRALTPRTDGVSIRVLNRDDRFELTNRSQQPILLYGYDDEPYARLLPDGTVEQNTSSPAYFLNQERDGIVAVPKSAKATARPTWKVLDRTHTFQWHDHRMHYMGKGIPRSVKDTKKRQKIYNYNIPIKIGDARGAISGTLWWTPQEDGGPPAVAIGALVAFVVLGVLAIVVAKRRRGGPDQADDGERPTAVEAW